MRLAIVVLCGLVLLGAAPPEGLTLEGQTGLLTVPSARTLREGTASLLYTPRTVPRFDGDAHTFVAAVGLFSFFEVAGRATEVNAASLRDLSLNLKLRAPLSRVHRLLPDVAVGAQDEGGAAPHFRTRYLVLSGDLYALRWTAGWGAGPDRLQGLFGGLEAGLHETTALIVEHDGERARAGARVDLPLSVAQVPFRVGAVAAVPLEQESLGGMRRWELGVTLSTRLALERTSPPPQTEPVATVASPEALLDALVADGFENVRVGTVNANPDETRRTLVVEYENAIFNHAERDGVQFVLARVAALRSVEPFEGVVLRLLHHGVPVSELRVPSAQSSVVTVRPAPRERSDVAWLEPRARNRTPLHLRLGIAPGLRTFLATEIGLLEFVLSARPEVTVPLWRGAAVYVQGDVPLGWTSAFRDGGPFAPVRGRPRVEEAMFLQGGRMTEGVLAQVGAGLFRRRHLGLTGEVWASPSFLHTGWGTHQLGVQAAAYRDVFEEEERQPSQAPSVRTAVTASWRAWSASGTSFAGLRAGRFLSGDVGASAEVGRAFGDTLFSLFVVRTERTVIGAAISLPLTPRRDMKPGWLQVSGTSRWRYSQATVVGETRNAVAGPPLGVTPSSTYTIEERWLDGGRATVPALTGPGRVAEGEAVW